MRLVVLALVACLILQGCLVARGLAGEGTPSGVSMVQGPDGQIQRVTLRGPAGEPVLEAQAGEGAGGRLAIAGLAPVRGPVTITLVGDPLADRPVAVVVEADGDRWVVDLPPTTGGAWEGSGAHRIVASPLAGPETDLAVAVGPVLLAGPGSVSPRFGLLAQVAVEAPGGYRPTGLVLDGQTVARVLVAGTNGSALIAHASMPAYRWPSTEQVELAVRVERELVPGLVHETLVGRTDLLLDRQGPRAPGLEVVDRNVTWRVDPGVGAWEAERRNGTGTWRPVAALDGRLAPTTSLAGGDEVRVRGIDPVGNPGPWSAPVVVPSATRPDLPPAPLPERWGPLAPGAELAGTVEVPWPDRAPVVAVRVLVDDPVTGTWQAVAQARESPLVWETRVLPDGVYLAKLEVETTEGTSSRFYPGLTVANLGPSASGPTDDPATTSKPVEVPVPDPVSPLPVVATLTLAALGGLASALIWRRKGTAK